MVTELLQLRAFCLGFEQYRNVRIGVFPECEEMLIRGPTLGGVALHRVGAAQLEMGQRADRFIQNNASMVEDFLFSTCTDLGSSGYDSSYGYGLVNASAATAKAEASR